MATPKGYSREMRFLWLVQCCALLHFIALWQAKSVALVAPPLVLLACMSFSAAAGYV
ncbi:hypothetical protein V8C86DRAFT_2947787 [Haematococcus lacustris]